MIDPLGHLTKPRAAKQFAKVTGRGMQDLPFHRGDADVVDEPPPETVATSVEQKQPPPGFEDAIHFGHGPILVGIVVEAVGAGHDIEGPIGKRQSLAIALDRRGPISERLPALAPAGEHAVDKVHSPDCRPRKGRRDAGGEYSRATTHVENRRRPVSRIAPAAALMMARCAGPNKSHWRTLRS